MANDSELAVKISATSDELAAAMNKCTQAVTQFSEQTKQQFSKIGDGLKATTLLAAFQPLKQAMEGMVRTIRDTVNASMAWDKEVRGLARTLGVSTTEAGGLAQALKGLNTDTDTYKNAVFALQRSLTSQEEALKANGIATRDADGNMLNTQQVMMNTIKRLKEMKPGYDANALAMLAFGRSAKDLDGILKLTNEGIEQGAAKVRELGIEVDAQSSGAVQTYRDAMNNVRDTLDALKIKLGQDLMPALAELAKTFANIAKAAAPVLAKVFQGLSDISKNWAAALGVLVVAMQGKVVAAIGSLTTSLKTMGAALMGPSGIILLIGSLVTLYQHLTDKTNKAAEAANRHAAAMAKSKDASLDELWAERNRLLKEMSLMKDKKSAQYLKMDKTLSDIDGAIAIAKIESAARAARAAGGTTGGTFVQAGAAKEPPKPAAAPAAAPAPLGIGPMKFAGMDAWRAEMDAMDKAAKEAAAARAKRALEERRLGTDLALARLEDERAALDHRLAMNQISAEERLKLEQELIQKERNIKAVALRQDMLEESLTLEQKAQANAQIALLDQELANKLRESARRTKEEQTRVWRELADSIQGALQGAMVGLINGTKSWGDATKELLNSILQDFIGMAVKGATEWMKQEALKLLFTEQTTAAQVGIKEMGAAEEEAVALEEGSTEIGINAAKAGSGAFAAMAGIPIVGPALGAAAMAAAMAAVMALMGKLASAAGGYWDVPHDQLAQIHKNEMVLPARHSARLRELLEGDGALPAQGQGGGSTSITINAVDARGVARLFRDNGSALVSAMKAQTRNYAFQV